MWRRKRGPEQDEDPFNLGVIAWQSSPRDLDAVKHWWERAAAAGDTRAMNFLGLLYATEVEPRDVAKGRDWFLRAADNGDATACYQLGVLAATSVTPNHKVAREWWQLAADAGHVTAMGCLGDLYAEMVPPDLELSRHWWERAAEGGLAEAMYRLGALAMSEATSDDLDISIRWYERAAEAGHSGAMFALGTLYEGVLDPPDLEAARRWFRRAIDAGHGAAERSLEALTATWTTPDGWSEAPPGDEQIRAMAEWFDRHERTVDEVIEGIHPAMDAIMEAVLSRHVPELRAACGHTGKLFAHRLARVAPTPDSDLTEAVRLLIGAGDQLCRLSSALPAHPTESDVQGVQGCVADIASYIERLLLVYARDREIVEPEDS